MDARRHGARGIVLTAVLSVGLTLGGMPIGAAAPVSPSSESPTTTASPAPVEESAVPPVEGQAPAATRLAVPSAAPMTEPALAKKAAPVAKKKKKKKKRYSPPEGVIFNSALGSAASKFRIHDHILRAVRKSRKGSTVRVMSWNMMSRQAVNDLLAAQKRGVRVRLLMDSTNFTSEVPNPQFARLRYGLAQGNKGRAPKRRSIAKVCQGSCRGEGGQAHAKFYLFSATGKAKRVLMQGSANLTRAASTNQWNDIQTFVNRRKLYDFSVKVFNQMWQDKPVKAPYVTTTAGKDTLYFSPLRGPNYKYDPVQRILNQTTCKGARGGAGNARGRTIIRVAPDVMRHQRGMRAAKRLKALWNQGCDVRIGYTVLGMDVSRVLKARSGRGPIPLRHLVQDNDGDGVFDKYFHLKAFTINGVVGKDRSAFITMNGSSNTSGSAARSDENSAIMVGRKKLTMQYQEHINYWFQNPPRSVPLNLKMLMSRGLPLDPYAKIDLD